MKHIILFSFLVFAFYTVVSQPKQTKTPNWVVKQTFEVDPDIDLKEISYGLLTLLRDEQINVTKQHRYVRKVTKITDNVGVQDGSNISINYDPSYQSLYIHKITVTRKGEKLNKLNLNDFQTIRQEANSENYIYDGSLNAIANLSDIRNGDIIDLSYSIVGFNPINGTHFSDITWLNDYQPVGKINYIVQSQKPLKYNLVNVNIKPKKTSKANGITTYQWVNELPEPPEFEDNTPSWHMSYNTLFVTDYNSWKDVVDWALSIYKTKDQTSTALEQKINQIRNSFGSEAKRIEATLKFVQEEIRYLGLEDGIGAYKPFSPSKVFEQRYGDCKDKSFLMVTMLNKMGIKANPVLINSTNGKSLHNFVPSPKAFDHVVVRVKDSLGDDYFYDPTITNQFGDYDKVAFPNYGKGLIIAKGEKDFVNFEPKNKDYVEVFDTFDIEEVGGNATLRVLSVYHEAEADAVRQQYKYNGMSSLSSSYKDFYVGLYEDVEVIKDLEIDDDSIRNQVTVEEFYRIKNIWSPLNGDDSKLAIEFAPYSINSIISIPEKKERNTPFTLVYPTHKKHNITIKLPQRWTIEKEDISISSKSFDYSFNSKMNRSKDILYLNYEYETKRDFVPVNDFEEYYKKAKELEKITGYYVYIPKSAVKSKGFKLSSKNESGRKFTSHLVAAFYWVLGLIIVIGVGLAVYVVYSNRNR